MTLRRKVPKLTAEQIALHGGITKNAHIFSLEAARKAFAHIDIERTGMTEPHQRTRALLKTIRFLDSLADLSAEPPVPQGVRVVARDLLKDYPTLDEIELIHRALPELFNSVIQRQAEGMPASAMEGSLQEGEPVLAADAGAVTVRALRDLRDKKNPNAVVLHRCDYRAHDSTTSYEGLAMDQMKAVDVRALKSRDSWFDPQAAVQLYRLCEDGDPELPDAVNGVLLGRCRTTG